jgi:type IV secretory pathway VirB3-like protein
MTHANSSARRTKIAWLAVVAGAFFVYNANFRELGLADTVPATLLPARIARALDFQLDEFDPLLDEKSPDGSSTLRKQVSWTLAIRRVGGHLRSSYPVGGAILAVPVYAIPAWAGWLVDYSDYRIAGKIASSLFVALSSGFVLLIMRRLATERVALALTILYSLGTTAWTIASQAMWQHGPALLCLSAALWAALRLEERDEPAAALLTSFSAAMTVVCRPQDIAGAAAIGAYALVRRPRRALYLVLPAVVVGAALVNYNQRAFGTLSGGYDALYNSPAHAFRGFSSRTVFTLPLLRGLSGLLFSAGKGLFIYTPVALVAFIALPLLAARNDAWLPRCLLLWVVGTLCFLGKNQLWWGGTSYGPRYLTELALPIVVTLALAWPHIARSRALAGGVIALAAGGVAVQALGAFTWECGWHISPSWIDRDLGRLWNYRDTEIARCAKVLAQQGPKAPEFGPFAQ